MLTRRDRRAEQEDSRRDHGAPEPADPFNRWVDRQLHSLYGPVAEEPIPPRLRALLDKAAEAVDGSQQGAADGATGGDDDEPRTGSADGHDGEDGPR
jgi:hypothetical protein